MATPDPSRPPRISLIGYAVLNAAAGLFLLLVYWLADRASIGARSLPAVGIGPPLLFVWLCFAAASVYDALFDRAGGWLARPAARRRRGKEAPPRGREGA
ncbi:MAG: hypothetical protein SF028_14910 [Candidatus Sumerlaeia bacterium]|nr:hypothetical protein [Candidatus Sumerlaeia bacterium]